MNGEQLHSYHDFGIYTDSLIKVPIKKNSTHKFVITCVVRGKRGEDCNMELVYFQHCAGAFTVIAEDAHVRLDPWTL